MRRTSSGPEGSKPCSSLSANSETEVHAGEGRSLVICGQTRKDGLVSGRRRPLDHQEESTECVCNPKSDSKRRGHHPGQEKGTRRPQMISRVSLKWLTEPQGQGARVFACSLRTWHLK